MRAAELLKTNKFDALRFSEKFVHMNKEEQASNCGQSQMDLSLANKSAAQVFSGSRRLCLTPIMKRHGARTCQVARLRDGHEACGVQ